MYLAIFRRVGNVKERGDLNSSKLVEWAMEFFFFLPCKGKDYSLKGNEQEGSFNSSKRVLKA